MTTRTDASILKTSCKHIQMSIDRFAIGPVVLKIEHNILHNSM